MTHVHSHFSAYYTFCSEALPLPLPSGFSLTPYCKPSKAMRSDECQSNYRKYAEVFIIHHCKILLHAVTSPENTQHCPYRTVFFVLQNSSRMAVLPVQASGDVVPSGNVLDQRPDKIPPSMSFELTWGRHHPHLFI